jgi:hypothetical protein
MIEPILSLVFHDTFVMIIQLVLTIALLNHNYNGAIVLYDFVVKKYLNNQN